MKRCLLMALFFYSFSSSAQNVNPDRGDSLFDYGIFVSPTLYSFAYTTDLENGSVAGGVSWFFNDERINLQIAFMFDFKKYYEWEGGILNKEKVERTSVFIPIILHYNYLRLRKAVYFFSLGVIPGSNFYLDERNVPRQRDGVPVLGGIGISHYILKRLYARASVNTQYVDKIFFPGVSLDLAIRLDARSQ